MTPRISGICSGIKFLREPQQIGQRAPFSRVSKGHFVSLVALMKKFPPIFLLFFLSSLPLHTPQASSAPERGAYQNKINNLESLLGAIERLSEGIVGNQEILKSSRGLGREQELKARIHDLSLKLRDLEESFDQVSTEVNVEVFETGKKKSLEWNVEITEVLGPVIREVKKMTSRPREIEQLRGRVDMYSSQLPVTRRALKNIDTLLTHTTSPRLTEKLRTVKRGWKNRENEVRTRMNIAAQQLEQRLAERKPLSQSFREILQIFFKSRGRNLILSFLAFVLTFLILHWILKLIQRYSPFYKKDRSFYVRVFDMVFIFVTVVFSLLALLAVLYFFGDWVLLSLAIIFFLGIGWASKTLIPRFWSQGKLILNLGPVREGERVVYNDLPYEIASINLFTELVNPDLEGGRIRLPLRDLLDLRSRPVSEKEPWFPSRSGDWVLLNDGTHGRVEVQSPEVVEMELLGGASVTYRTVDYLSRSPVNLSSGFRLWITFGVDFALKGIVIQEIPERLEKAIIDGLTSEGHGESFHKITVQFKEPGTYSLDVEIMADFKGSAGSDYFLLNRVIQRICVDTCNRHHWVIPLQQVKVEMATPTTSPE